MASYDTTTAYQQYLYLGRRASQVHAKLLRNSSQACTPENIIVRKEWKQLTSAERKSYTNAVLCLQNKTGLTPRSFAPGARTRYDDWVATHINQTDNIHYTGNFLSWHRYFTWQYEQTLRNECGYNGSQPYWNWALTSSEMGGLNNSAVWDGSETSISGNGLYIPNRPDRLVRSDPSHGLAPMRLPIGSGGGCVTSGPLKNYTVNLGPAGLALDNGSTIIDKPNGLKYNPRCLKRDLTQQINDQYVNATSMVRTLIQPDIWSFEWALQGDINLDDLGVHGGGHWIMGGDPGDDLHTSPGDPAFFLHHSMVDKMWWIWQMLGEESAPGYRMYDERGAVSGTGTFLNVPPSANQTFETIVQQGWVGDQKPMRIKDLMSTIEGPFCYTYSVEE